MYNGQVNIDFYRIAIHRGKFFFFYFIYFCKIPFFFFRFLIRKTISNPQPGPSTNIVSQESQDGLTDDVIINDSESDDEHKEEQQSSKKKQICEKI